MKNILLTIMISTGFFTLLNAQVVLNETYGNPGSGNSQFIEVYNSSTLGAEALDCYTLLTYWDNGLANTDPDYRNGWYVLDFPDDTIDTKDWYVLAADSPFNVQSQTNVSPNFSWNELTFRDGTTGGYLKKYYQDGGSYSDSSISNSSPVWNLFPLGDFYTGQNRLLLLFKNGVLVNGFWGGGPTGILPAAITGMNDLTVTPSSGCGGAFVVDFSTLGAIEFVNESGGNDNGYARLFDGLCGSWDKTSSGSSHTPGTANGSAAGQAGSLTTAEFITCQTGASFPFATANFDISGVSGDVTEADDFPVEVQIYRDVNFDGQLDAGDTLVAPIQVVNAVADPGQSVDFIASNSGSEELLFVYKTQRGCFDKVVLIVQACASLPVELKSFTAARVLNSVDLRWETVTEENNLGFYIQRKIGTGNWETVGFVPSQARNGNSNTSLVYGFSDENTTKGITQYRLRQVDIDGKYAFSVIRAVRGDGQTGSTIVYPNPSSNGTVNLVFSDAQVIRNVRLVDMNGRILKHWNKVSGNILQINDLTPGFYTIRILNTDTGEQEMKKIIVTKM